MIVLQGCLVSCLWLFHRGCSEQGFANKSLASIYTSDLSRALRVSAKIETGSVSINAPHYPNHLVPFGGFKESGSGKELGKYGLMSYLQTKTVLIK
jgi:acyl-CoA reductase-like NAD-dependent aldehyde dehydrogenase